MAAISGFAPAIETEGRQESLVLALQALSRFHAEAPARPAAGYDLISALSGNMFIVATSFGQPCPAWWILGSRAQFLEFAGQVIGLAVQPLSAPPEGLDLAGQQAFFREEMLPRIEAEIAAGRPVLARGGFPGFGWGLWGVLTRTEAGKAFGLTCWFQYSEQSVGEEFPVQVVYAVQASDRSKRIPIREILQHAAELYQNQGEPGWTTGPAAYERWMDHISNWAPCSPECADLANCHRQMASFVHDARMTAARFLDFLNEELPPTLRRYLPGIVEHNRQITTLLRSLATSQDPAALLGEKEGRKEFLATLAKVREHEECLGAAYAELARQRDWDAPPPKKRVRPEKAKGRRARDEKDSERDKDKGKDRDKSREKPREEREKEREERVRAEAKARGWRKISD
ncbi:MAG: hypothetical protein JXQ29_01275 [Planctomycetes bacterium]|nr:hypothetical protein [Planctomycetota bacterium]